MTEKHTSEAATDTVEPSTATPTMTEKRTDGVATDSVEPLQATLVRGNVWRKFNDTILVSGTDTGSLEISFQRTVRVPDNKGENHLPPSLGTFPLYSTASFVKTLPARMAKKGGAFFPMYRRSQFAFGMAQPSSRAVEREAMWIKFQSRRLFAISLYVGGVNVVSGEPATEDVTNDQQRLAGMAEKPTVQDYIVTPDQLWLDGIAFKAGSVRQFVAMPLGSGYSVEAQVTGDDVMGGLQFLVVPSKAKPRNTHQPGSITINIKIFSGTVVQIPDLRPTNRISDIKGFIQDVEGTLRCQQRLSLGERLLHDGETIAKSNISNGATLFLELELTGGGSDPSNFERELGVAAGGLIKQCVVEDNFPKDSWASYRAVSFHVQILNSQTFQHVTNRPPPSTPVTSQTYATRGLPFFDIHNEASKVGGDFQKVKSVVTMDKEKADKKRKHEEIVDESPVDMPVVLLNTDGTPCGFKPVNVMMAELKSSQLQEGQNSE